MPKIVACLFALIFFLSFHPPVFANSHIVINEFASDVESGQKEWVEFYNSSSTNQSLAGWFVEERTGADLSGVSSYPLDSITITAQGFEVYEFSGSKLNNGGDILTLKNGETEVDEIAYGSAPNSQVAAPDKSQSAGRKTDGSSNWVIFSSSTKHSTNNAGQVLPDPTPTPTPTPESSTSQSTSQTNSPTPTPKTTSTATSKSPSPTSAKQSPLVLSASDQNSSPQVLSTEASESSSPSPEATPSALSKTKVAGILAGSGIVLIGLSFGFYLWYKRILRSSPPEADAGLNRILGNPKKEQSENQS